MSDVYLIKTAALELGKLRINVNAIYPAVTYMVTIKDVFSMMNKIGEQGAQNPIGR